MRTPEPHVPPELTAVAHWAGWRFPADRRRPSRGVLIAAAEILWAVQRGGDIRSKAAVRQLRDRCADYGARFQARDPRSSIYRQLRRVAVDEQGADCWLGPFLRIEGGPSRIDAIILDADHLPPDPYALYAAIDKRRSPLVTAPSPSDGETMPRRNGADAPEEHPPGPVDLGQGDDRPAGSATATALDLLRTASALLSQVAQLEAAPAPPAPPASAGEGDEQLRTRLADALGEAHQLRRQLQAETTRREQAEALARRTEAALRAERETVAALEHNLAAALAGRPRGDTDAEVRQLRKLMSERPTRR